MSMCIWEVEWRATVTLQHRRDVPVRVYCNYTVSYLNYGPQQNKNLTAEYSQTACWPRSLQVRTMYKLGSRDSTYDLDVKLSPCMCTNSSFPDWQQTVRTLLLFMVCAPWHKQSDYVLLVQACPTMLKHLPSTRVPTPQVSCTGSNFTQTSADPGVSFT